MERNHALDLIRVTAMSFVVAVHCLSVVDTASASGHYFYLVAVQVLFTCNSLFFLMSGKLNIRKREDDKLYPYYIRKIRNIAIPILVIFVLYTIYVQRDNLTAWSFITSLIKGTLSSYGTDTPYWFMYTLVGFLAVAPFLGRIFQGIQRKHIIVFCVLGLSYNTMVYITANNPSVDFGWGYPFRGFAFIFCFGALIDKLINRRKLCNIVIILMPVCLLLNSILIENGITKNAYDLSPLATILSIGMYCLIVRIASHIRFERHALATRVLRFLSDQSFIVYLIHTMFLGVFKSIFAGFPGIESIFAQIGCTTCVLAASVAAAFAIRWIVIKPLQKLFDLVINSAHISH